SPCARRARSRRGRARPSQSSLSAQGGEALTARKILRALSHSGTQQSGVPSSSWVPILRGLSGTILQPTSTPSLHHILVPRRGAFHAPRVPPPRGHGPILRKWGWGSPQATDFVRVTS